MAKNESKSVKKLVYQWLIRVWVYLVQYETWNSKKKSEIDLKSVKISQNGL